MKREKKLLLLCLALIIVAGAAIAAVKFIPDEEVEEAETIEVCTIDTGTITRLEWSYEGESLSFDWDGMTGFDVELGGETYSVSMEYSEDENAYLYTLGDESLELDDLLDKVEALSREGSADGAQGLEELISFSFHAEGWDDVELTLYSYDSGSCLVEINGEALAFTERSSAEALRDAAAEVLQAE